MPSQINLRSPQALNFAAPAPRQRQQPNDGRHLPCFGVMLSLGDQTTEFTITCGVQPHVTTLARRPDYSFDGIIPTKPFLDCKAYDAAQKPNGTSSRAFATSHDR